jgi:hypothetical protein
MKGLYVIALLATAALAGCGPDSSPVLDQNGQPTGQSVQQPSGPGVGTGAILGGLAGYMLGRHSASPVAPAGGGYSAPPTVVHRNTTIIQKKTVIVNKPSYSKPPSNPPRYSAPRTSGGFRSSGGGSSRGGRR